MIGVYIARTADGEPLYVGSSGNIEKRLTQHAKTASWWADAATVEKVETDNRALAYHRERGLIQELDPPHNQRSARPAKVRHGDVGPVVRPRAEAFAEVIDSYGSVPALARAIGCNKMTVSEIWRGVHYPSTKVIARLMVVTGLAFDDLFYVETTDATVDQWLSKRAPRVSA